MRPIIALSLSLAILPGLASSARADLIFETEPNDTFATANATVGLNEISYEGYLTLGDVDTFTMMMTPNSAGVLSYSLQVEWFGFSPTFDRYLNLRQNPPFNLRITRGYLGPNTTITETLRNTLPGIHTDQLWALPVFAFGDPVTGSTFEGGYRVTYRALNGTIIQGTGTSVPEPSSILLGLALSGSGLWLKRRSKKGNY